MRSQERNARSEREAMTKRDHRERPVNRGCRPKAGPLCRKQKMPVRVRPPPRMPLQHQGGAPRWYRGGLGFDSPRRLYAPLPRWASGPCSAGGPAQHRRGAPRGRRLMVRPWSSKPEMGVRFTSAARMRERRQGAVTRCQRVPGEFDSRLPLYDVEIRWSARSATSRGSVRLAPTSPRSSWRTQAAAF
jgi:hypothetical protein